MKIKFPRPGQRIWVGRHDIDTEWQKLIVTEIRRVKSKLTKKIGTLIHYQGRLRHKNGNTVYIQGCCMPKEVRKIRDSELDSYELFRRAK